MLHKWQEEMTIKGDILNFHYLGYATHAIGSHFFRHLCNQYIYL